MSNTVAAQKPIPSRLSKAAVHDFAEQVALQLQFGPGDPIEPIVVRLGGSIQFYSPLDQLTGIPESIAVEPGGRFTIFMTSLTSAKRDRFTIAHEIGHLVLHFPLVQSVHPGNRMVATRWVDSSDMTQQRVEWEANWFAAAFLMPQDRFKADYAVYRDPSIMATVYDVSKKAAEIRIKDLGL